MSAGEHGWLIELPGPRYWTAAGWTPDAGGAVRFAREQDAQAVIDQRGIATATVTLKAFSAPRTDAKPSPSWRAG